MDMANYRDALLRKRGELLGGNAAKPLQWTMENNSGRQGDMADQASGNNAEARLNAIPWTRSCITCKEKQKA